MKSILSLCLVVLSLISNAAWSQEPNIDNWEDHRAEGLANLHRIMTNVMVVNAQDVFSLNYQARDFALHEIPSVARVMKHPAVSGLVVITEDGDVLLEHYGNGKDRKSTLSDQSATKSVGWILLNKAIKDGKISLADKVEKHIPEIGPGFKGRTIGDVAAMAVHHNVAELAAYTGDPVALKMFKRSDVIFGFGRNDKQETLAEFVQTIEAGGENIGRYGLLFTPSWNQVAHEQIISDALIKRIQTEGRPEIYNTGITAKKINGYLGEQVAFETRQWDFVLEDGDFGKSGYHGQTLYISPSKDLVVVSFATGKGYDTWSFARAIRKALK